MVAVGKVVEMAAGVAMEARDPIGDAGKEVVWHGATLEEAR